MFNNQQNIYIYISIYIYIYIYIYDISSLRVNDLTRTLISYVVGQFARLQVSALCKADIQIMCKHDLKT